MRKRALTPIGLIAILALAACAAQMQSTVQVVQIDGVAAEHVDLDEWEMLTPCSDCHREETPEIVDSWYASTHGIANVKCYQCHGTYEEMQRVPAMKRCAACHEDKVSSPLQGKTCWDCHPAHNFSGHH